MEEELNGKSNGAGDEAEKEEEDIQNGVVFVELKEHCMQLLELLQNSEKDNSFLPQLLHLLRRSPSHSLQPFFDYTLFPLLLLFDAAVNSRSTTKLNSKNNNSLEFDALVTSHKVSDTVAECVVLCLEEVLKKCRLLSVDQMVVILKKLAYGAMLSPAEASEEFRDGVIKCFRALLLNLRTCSDESCPCKQIDDFPVFKELQFPVFNNSISVTEECLLAFLQSEIASAAIGHWLSLLLKAADIEVARGHRGSSRLRVEALMTLRVLVAKVGTADALAFYLPGFVSQTGKILHTSRTMISGAAASTESLNQAVRGLSEYLMIVLDDNSTSSILHAPENDVFALDSNKTKPLSSYLEELRQLPVKNAVQSEVITESVDRGTMISVGDSDCKIGSLRVKRTEKWLAETTSHVNKLLSSTFPHLCVHPNRKVRLGVLASIRGLLRKCSYTLRDSRLMLLECLFVLVCDDSEDVSSEAQTFTEILVSSGKNQIEQDMSEVFSRLVEKLPRVVMADEESLALSHARKLLAVTYYGGPRLVADYLLVSPVAAARFLDVFALCLSQNSVFAGPLNQLAAKSPSKSGFMHSISEIKAITTIAHEEKSEFLGSQNRNKSRPYEHVKNEYELPNMPPWFVHVGSRKLYQALSGILRLVSLYIFTDSRNEGSYCVLIDILLGHFRNLTSELRTREHRNDSWQSWYKRTGSAHLVRRASTASCILNEMIYGLSDQASTSFNGMFRNKGIYVNSNGNKNARIHLIDCIGSILHEYLSPEIWNIPLGFSDSLEQFGEDGDINLHVFNDNGMLHQVIIEGIGIFNICLGEEFSSSGFLHSSLYMLLENIICSNFEVRRASDSVLHVISATQNCPTVGHLVLANSDYVIDSICRQLRHLDLNPHVPNVLSAMLSFVGVADKILPLLEEPMHAVSMELEILGRHHHPNLTLPFLKAVAEIAKASKHEADKLPNQAESYKKDMNAKMSELNSGIRMNDANVPEEELESIIFKFNDSKRYRRIVGSIAGSCLVSVTPLIASADPASCLTALDVIEDGIIVLSKVEEAYKHESETKEALREIIESCSFYNLLDTLGADEDETIENRLLPAVNKIWPFLVSCFRSKNLVAIKKCCRTITTVVQICGGDFFSRRFHSDGAHFWKLLSTSPFQKKKPFSKEERMPLQLPYRKSWTEDSSSNPSEISNLKLQIAILEMISDLSKNKRSAPSLDPVFKKISGVVVGIACSGVKGLQGACENALVGLASVDPDLVWLLLADVYYSRKGNIPCPPSDEFPEIGEVLPVPSSSKEYLYVLYGGQSYGFDVDFNAVEIVYKKLCAEVFTSQTYK
ncbi:hypothetical protein ABFS82_08G161200 [Erythranthe guttata]|uniref:TELO2-interacting protein 1 homolog n=1 Tax=Erythranthe guttata TaxID=4155 RepID=A0A022R4N4_ERYGU|nr:PREDICTED: TELO2-interacting protein 1 homolog [Erythranthe guttata]EYU33785.1 hypothetical protein MIMGU_mgv1a000271mg [Erythranthe guttata]|eukprot:XP_012841875.1 PREDICTED: TELO2-interacting protein 1 homolog [Erythranthe guttata]